MKNILALLSNQKIQALVFLVIILAFYGNTLSNGFVHDDAWQIADNKNIQKLENLPKVFTSCLHEDLLAGGCKKMGFYYRPTQYLSYFLTYQVSSQPWFFHLVNLVYALIASLLVLRFFKIFLQGKHLPFVATLLFITHPINSEPINWLSCVVELTLAGFMMATYLLYIKFSESKKMILLVLSAFTFLGGLFSKETAALAILIVPIYEFLFKGFRGDRSTVKRCLLVFALYVTAGVIYVLSRAAVLGRVVYEYEGYYKMDAWSQALNALVLYPKYLFKLIYPLPLNLQERVVLATGDDWRVTVAFLLVMLNFFIVFIFFKKGWKVMLLATSLIVLSILTPLIFINKIGQWLIGERYLFMSSIGMALLVGEIIRRLILRYKDKAFRNILLVLFAVYLVFSWFIIFQRNKDWKDNTASYIGILKADPGNAEAHYQLGNIYAKQNQLDLAAEQFQQASKLDPRFAATLVNKFTSAQGLSFLYPVGWIVNEEKSIHIQDEKGEFKIEVGLDALSLGQSTDRYLAKQEKVHGALINQGAALIPNMDQAFVKIFKDERSTKMQFFLFKGDKVIKILVDPMDSPLMKQFDAIVSSLKFS